MSSADILTLPAPLSRHLRTGRELIEARKRQPLEESFTTASPALDRLLDGGLRRGAMVELIGRRSCGRFTLVMSTLAAATASGETVALIDLGDSFDPKLAVTAGMALERLLWVRPRRMKEALLSAEAILQCGMPLVVIDLGLPPLPGGRGIEASWLRLARAASAHRAALLIASPYRVSGTAAWAVVEAWAKRSVWRGRGRSPRLLTRLETCLELAKGQRRRPGDREEVVAYSEAAIVRIETSVVDEPKTFDRPVGQTSRAIA